jgi:hypothetical protein
MPFSLLAPAAALKMICVDLRTEKQLCKATQARHVFVSAAWLFRIDVVEAELEALASSTLTRYRLARMASRRLLTTRAALLPSAAQAQWRDDLLGELHTMVTSRGRARFTAHTLSGVSLLGVTLRWPALRSRQVRP